MKFLHFKKGDDTLSVNINEISYVATRAFNDGFFVYIEFNNSSIEHLVSIIFKEREDAEELRRNVISMLELEEIEKLQDLNTWS